MPPSWYKISQLVFRLPAEGRPVSKSFFRDLNTKFIEYNSKIERNASEILAGVPGAKGVSRCLEESDARDIASTT